MSYQIACDVHTHTLFSRHAYSTIAENIAACREMGVELLGSTDHFSEMLFPEQHLRNFQYFLNQTAWPRVWDGVVLLRGAEVAIVSLDGDLFGQDIDVPDTIVGRRYAADGTLFDRVTGSLDYLIASVHNGDFARGATVVEATRMYVGALEDPRVLILGHPARAGIEFDVDEVLLAARAHHKLIEINNHTLETGSRRHDSCRAIAVRCAELGVGITVSSDAHVSPQIGRCPHALGLLEEIGFPQELIADRDRASFLAAVRASGVADGVRDLPEA